MFGRLDERCGQAGILLVGPPMSPASDESMRNDQQLAQSICPAAQGVLTQVNASACLSSCMRRASLIALNTARIRCDLAGARNVAMLVHMRRRARIARGACTAHTAHRCRASIAFTAALAHDPRTRASGAVALDWPQPVQPCATGGPRSTLQPTPAFATIGALKLVSASQPE